MRHLDKPVKKLGPMKFLSTYSLHACNHPPIPKPLLDLSVIFFVSMIVWPAYHAPLWGEINKGMVPEVNEIDGATEVNEDKHLVHGNRFRTSKKDALKTPRKCEQVKDSYDKGKLVEWLCYHSAKSGDELTNLRDYITGESKKAIESSQFLEKLKKKKG